jgi:hypothetical protein
MFISPSLITTLEGYELVDRPPPTATQKDPYDWEPPHWVPNPVPADYDIMSPPWIRPEQLPMSFVGESVVLAREDRCERHCTATLSTTN